MSTADWTARTAAQELFRDAWRERHKVSGLFIEGVEVTQAIQYYRAEDHLADAADRGPDNSVPARTLRSRRDRRSRTSSSSSCGKR